MINALHLLMVLYLSASVSALASEYDNSDVNDNTEFAIGLSAGYFEKKVVNVNADNPDHILEGLLETERGPNKQEGGPELNVTLRVRSDGLVDLGVVGNAIQFYALPIDTFLQVGNSNFINLRTAPLGARFSLGEKTEIFVNLGHFSLATTAQAPEHLGDSETTFYPDFSDLIPGQRIMKTTAPLEMGAKFKWALDNGYQLFAQVISSAPLSDDNRYLGLKTGVSNKHTRYLIEHEQRGRKTSDGRFTGESKIWLAGYETLLFPDDPANDNILVGIVARSDESYDHDRDTTDEKNLTLREEHSIDFKIEWLF